MDCGICASTRMDDDSLTCFLVFSGAGLLKLHDDIQTCGYEDVQIMWEMLRRTESEIMPHQTKRKHRWFLKNLTWSNNNGAASSFPTVQTE